MGESHNSGTPAQGSAIPDYSTGSVGIACEDDWGVVVFEAGLEPTIQHPIREGWIEFGDPVETLRAIIARSEREGRLVLAWTQREAEMIAAHYNGHADLQAWASDGLVNAKLIAKWWFNANRTRLERRVNPEYGHPSDGRLLSYVGLIGRSIPEKSRGEGTSDRIKDVRSHLLEGGDTVTASTRLPRELAKEWKHMLRHNYYDCVMMREVMLFITKQDDKWTRRRPAAG